MVQTLEWPSEWDVNKKWFQHYRKSVSELSVSAMLKNCWKTHLVGPILPHFQDCASWQRQFCKRVSHWMARLWCQAGHTSSSSVSPSVSGVDDATISWTTEKAELNEQVTDCRPRVGSSGATCKIQEPPSQVCCILKSSTREL